MNRFRKLWLGAVGLMLTTWMVSPVAAATNTPTAGNEVQSISLLAAKQLALERNWDLLAAKSSIDAATAQLIITKEFPNPTISLSTARIGSDNSSTYLGNGLWERSYDSIAAVSQLIEIGGKRHDRQLTAQAGVMGAKARFLETKRLLDQGVTKAYVAVLLADENAHILRESAGFMQHEQEIAESRYKAGDIAESDLKQIRVAAGQYVLQATAADVTATQARIAVEILLGVHEPNGNWQPTDSLAGVIPLILQVNELKTNAMRPDVLAAETDLRATEANLKLAKADRVPDPTLTLGGEHNPPGGGPAEDTFLVGVSFPLPLWNWNKGNIDSAKAAIAQSQLALEKLRAQAAGDRANAETACHEATERLQRYRDEISPQSASARASVVFKYEHGGASLVDLLEAERADNDVRMAMAMAAADTASTSADLAAAKTAVTEAELAP